MATTTTTTTPAQPLHEQPQIQPQPRQAAVHDHNHNLNMNTSLLMKRMSVDKRVVDELLLVCGVIGTAVSSNNAQSVDSAAAAAFSSPSRRAKALAQSHYQSVTIVPVTDCANWLQDLQRALRRDDDLYRPISLLLSDWNVVQQKLLPLVLSCRYDSAIVLTVCKILVILTKPLAERTVQVGRNGIHIHKKKTSSESIAIQMKLRENALKQAQAIVEYKRIICHHSSHHRDHRHNDGSGGDGGVLSIFVSLLAEPLHKTGMARTDHDHLIIELVLHLFRNLLSAEPLQLSSSAAAASSIYYQHAQLHNELLYLLDQELVLEILLVLASDLEARENAPYNLLLLELVHHLLRHQDPAHVVIAALAHTSSCDDDDDAATTTLTTATTARGVISNHQRSTTAAPGGSILQAMARQKPTPIAGSAVTSSRHGHFGGTLAIRSTISTTASNISSSSSNNTRGAAGSQPQLQQQYVSAARLGQARITAAPVNIVKRKHKRTDPFVGGDRRNPMTNDLLLSSSSSSLTAASGCSSSHSSPAQRRASAALHRFCLRFVNDCYGAVLKSWKNEFRRDSARLQQDDLVVFMRIVWFFKQYKRLLHQSLPSILSSSTTTRRTTSPPPPNADVGSLIFTMDVFTFNLVMNATDTFTSLKKWTSLATAIALLSEMMHWLFLMLKSPQETEQIMALGLMDRIFYNSEPLDRLPKLLSNWEPGLSSRQCLCDLVEFAYMTLKLLDTNAKSCHDHSNNAGDPTLATMNQNKIRGKGKKSKKTVSDDSAQDTIAKMKEAALDFDVNAYFAKKLVSNHTVYMYTQLLAHYSSNTVQTNHRVLAFFLRLSKFTLNVADPEAAHFPLAAKTVTFEPMLYNVQMFIVLDRILNDMSIRKNKNFESLLAFATSLIQRFAKSSRENPLLFVEALLRHALPHRFCDMAMNRYVTEELRMLAEREMLIEEQRRLENENATTDNDEDDDNDADADNVYRNKDNADQSDVNDSDSDSEQEFQDDMGVVKLAPKQAIQPTSNRTGNVVDTIKRHRGSTIALRKATAATFNDDSSSDNDSDNDSIPLQPQPPSRPAIRSTAHLSDSDDDNHSESSEEEESNADLEENVLPSSVSPTTSKNREQFDVIPMKRAVPHETFHDDDEDDDNASTLLQVCRKKIRPSCDNNLDEECHQQQLYEDENEPNRTLPSQQS